MNNTGLKGLLPNLGRGLFITTKRVVGHLVLGIIDILYIPIALACITVVTLLPESKAAKRILADDAKAGKVYDSAHKYFQDH